MASKTRARQYACRVKTPAPLLTVAEYALIRPMVPVILGGDMPKRPTYVPEGAVYVSRAGRARARRARRSEVTITVAIIMALTATIVALTLAWQNTAQARGVPDPGYLVTVTPTTYGPPPS